MGVTLGTFDFEELYLQLQTDFVNGTANPVDTGHWQAMKGVPQTKTYEIANAILPITVPQFVSDQKAAVSPNLPWAEDHFAERVGGVPVNPPPSAKDWPFAQAGHKDHVDEQQQFSHTYPERMWPKQAGGLWDDAPEIHGIRYRYGDLDDLVNLLVREPYTRQAYLPIWFPEDTGAHAGQRVPCSLGYHFMLRDGKLSCSYFIRSCDFLRHFRDDVYMAMRLMQWVGNQCHDRTGSCDGTNLWCDVYLGGLYMHIPSLHVFEGDMPRLRKLVNAPSN